MSEGNILVGKRKNGSINLTEGKEVRFIWTKYGWRLLPDYRIERKRRRTAMRKKRK